MDFLPLKRVAYKRERAYLRGGGGGDLIEDLR